MFRRPSSLVLSLCLLALVALLPLAGCGGSDEEVAASAPVAPQAPEKPEMTPKETRQAERKARQAARAAMEKEPDVPEDFELPDDVPAYPGATVTNVGVNDGDKLAVTFSSDGGAEDVAQYYFEELRHGDWSVDQTDAPDGVALFAEKGSRSMTVMVEKRPEGARISILSMRLDLALP